MLLGGDELGWTQRRSRKTNYEWKKMADTARDMDTNDPVDPQHDRYVVEGRSPALMRRALQ
jgi:hypothetical protein